MDILKIPEDQPIESGMVSKSLEQAQSKVESFHFDQRKHVVEYDDVMNKQREIIYKRRFMILTESEIPATEPSKLKDRILDAIRNEIDAIVTPLASGAYTKEDIDAIVKDFLLVIPFDKASQEQIAGELLKLNDIDAIKDKLMEVVAVTYENREAQMGPEAMRQIERYVALSTIDQGWMDHLDAVENLREGIWLRGGKEQVLTEYKREAFDMFERLLLGIDSNMAKLIFRLQPAEMPVQPVIPEEVFTGKQEDFNEPIPSADGPVDTGDVSAPKTTAQSGSVGAFAAALAKTSNLSPASDGRTPHMVKVVSGQPKIGRNDPCPCGSGKKWKKCHYPELPPATTG